MSRNQVSVASPMQEGASFADGAAAQPLAGSAAHLPVGAGSRASGETSGEGVGRYPSGFPLASFRPQPGARAALERRAGSLLRLVRDKDLYRALGFVRLGDFVIEELGISYRGAQEMMRVDEALEKLPLVTAAFEAGAISSGHVRLLAGVVDPDSEAFWVGLARRTGVKALARIVAERRKKDGDLALDMEQCSNGAAGGASSASAMPAADGASENEPALQELQIVAPAWIAGFWRDSIWLVRRLVGSHLPPGACFEMVLAEVADSVTSGVDHDAEEVGRTGLAGGAEADAVVGAGGALDGAGANGNARPRSVEQQRSGATSQGRSGLHGVGLPPADTARGGLPAYTAVGPQGAGAAETEDRADIGAALETFVPLEQERDRVSRIDGATPTATPSMPDARAVEQELLTLFAERQRQDALLGDHLRLVALDRGYREYGCASLEEYAAERFGLSHGRLYNILALQRRLASLPALRREFLAGRISTRQALLIGSVATCLTLEAWVRRAGRVTLRRLDDEVSYWRHLKESRPAVWELLEGGPLPEGIVLAPGQAPRLHESAFHRPTNSKVRSRAAISAESFLNALDQDEGTTPLPDRMCVIKLLVEPEVREMWEATLAHLRATVRANLLEGDALALVLRELWRVWDNKETRRQRRDNPTAERDGWRCTAPGCWSVGTGRLHEHHIVYRSRGGALTDPTNLTTLCSGHHLGLLHDGRMRCWGLAPDGLVWELGVERGREPFLIYSGEVRIGGSAA